MQARWHQRVRMSPCAWQAQPHVQDTDKSLLGAGEGMAEEASAEEALGEDKEATYVEFE